MRTRAGGLASSGRTTKGVIRADRAERKRGCSDYAAMTRPCPPIVDARNTKHHRCITLSDPIICSMRLARREQAANDLPSATCTPNTERSRAGATRSKPQDGRSRCTVHRATTNGHQRLRTRGRWAGVGDVAPRREPRPAAGGARGFRRVVPSDTSAATRCGGTRGARPLADVSGRGPGASLEPQSRDRRLAGTARRRTIRPDFCQPGLGSPATAALLAAARRRLRRA
jgi:hypothetical protein